MRAPAADDRRTATTGLRHPTAAWAMLLAVVASLASIVFLAQPAYAASPTLYVSATGSDTGNNCQRRTAPCATIGHALSQAVSGDTIIVGAGTFRENLTVSINATIRGTRNSKTIVDGNSAGRVFEISSGSIVTLTNLVIRNGTTCGAYGAGVENRGTLTLSNATISGNIVNPPGCGIGGDFGGGVFNWNVATLVADTVSGNSGDEVGGGFGNCGAAALTDVTVVGNSAYDAAGIFNECGTIALTSDTISGNTTTGGAPGGVWSQVNPSSSISFGATIVANNTPGDCVIYNGPPNDAGYNIDSDGTCGFSSANHSQSGVNPQLGPLANNGGPTATMSPQLGSPALNQIPSGTILNSVSVCPGTDQRGVARPQTSLFPNCDVGAVELKMPIKSLVFTGNTAAPTITIKGSNLGTPPVGVSNNTTPCGSYTNNGDLYGENLVFTDAGNFTAGEGTPPSGDCVGITITSWSSTKIVLKFGNAYDSFDHWFITAGDSFTLMVKGAQVSGTVAFS